MFVPANPHLEVLEEYKGDLGDAYWDKWEKNPYKVEKSSFIDHNELKKGAGEMGYKHVRKVEEIAVVLE